MTIEGRLSRGPQGYGLPKEFSITGEGNKVREERGAVDIGDKRFFGLCEGEGGYVLWHDPHVGVSRRDVRPGETENVEVYVSPTKIDSKKAVYEVKGK